MMAGNIAQRAAILTIFATALSGCYARPQVYLDSPTLPAVGGQLAQAEAPVARLSAPVGPPATPPIVLVSDEAPVAYGDTLTIGAAVRRALRSSPAVHAAALEIDAKRGEALQAGLRPNPELGGWSWNVGEDPQEEALDISQLFELGGKRLKRIRAAELDVGVTAWDYEAARLRVTSDTAQTFVDVLASQDRIKVLSELQAVAETFSDAVSGRVQTGGANLVDVQRARIEVTRAKAQVNEEKAILAVAKRRLANNWASRNADFSSVKGELKSPDHVPSAEQINVSLESNPDIARWAEEMVRRQAILDLERAKAIPDITLTAGARRVENSDDTGAVLQVSVPLPLFNRNQGDIAAAQSRLLKARHEGLAARVDVNAVFLEAYSRMAASAQRLKGLEKDILPSAQELYDATSKGYLVGGFDLLNVLDAQRSLYAVRLEIVNARADFQKAKVQIEALTGCGLSEF
jgi:cobalt-zinc-cadmium efflux system outer membrane protein